MLDQGHPGEPLPVVPSSPPPPDALRGRGLIIISRLSDDFELSAHGDGTQVDVGFLRDRATEPATCAEFATASARAA